MKLRHDDIQGIPTIQNLEGRGDLVSRLTSEYVEGQGDLVIVEKKMETTIMGL